MSAPQVGDVITTAEELDALPQGTVILTESGMPHARSTRHEHALWVAPAARAGSLPMSSLAPLTIAYLPGQPPRPERVVKAESLRHAADWVAHSLVGDPTAIDALEVVARNLLAEADRIEAGEPR